MNELVVWRNQQRLGTLRQSRGNLQFVYEPKIVDKTGIGVPLVSMSLPTSNRTYTDKLCRPFFDGLLPEGETRRIIAYDFKLSESDTFALLAAIGADCAGALAILNANREPPVPLSVDTLPSVNHQQVSQMISALRFNPLGVNDGIRVSLGGVQEKLLLTKTADGWSLPTSSVASTHILKPAISGLDSCVSNEAACLEFARQLDIPSAHTSIANYNDREVLIVERFDRSVGSDSTVRRMHQETLCQALAIPVASVVRKYEDDGGPTFQSAAKLLRRWSDTPALNELLRQLAVNVLVGNADAHAMNMSFVISEDGAVSLAPLYDVFSTLAYPQLTTTAGMFVNNRRDIRAITFDDVSNEGQRWGLSPDTTEEILGSIRSGAKGAMKRALDIVPCPNWLAKHLNARIRTVCG